MTNKLKASYQFEKNKPKGECPVCGKPRVFRYYEGLPREFGICERLNNCGHHNKPDGSIKPSEVPKVEPKPQVYVVEETKVQMWLDNLTSNFHTYCLGLGISMEHLQKWRIGTDRGQTVFVHQNAKNEFSTAKFIAYTEGGSRSKERDAYYMKSPKEGRYVVSLFGEHLLRTDFPIIKNMGIDDIEQEFTSDYLRRVCIVESEKTAVIASFFYPDYDWVACGSNAGLTDEKTGSLVGREVYNLRDADIAGRSTCSLKKLEDCKTPLKCSTCKIPHIEKRLIQWNIKYTGLDLFPEDESGYDLADAIKDGVFPDIAQAETEAITKAFTESLPNRQTDTAKETTASTQIDEDIDDELNYFEKQDRRYYLRSLLPRGVDVDNVIEYGFYEHKQCYYMAKKEDSYEKVSNFTMKVRFLIVGVNPKRIVEITNVHKKTVVIDFSIEDLISTAKFKARIESVGNFLFEGKDSDLSRIKNKLYNLEKASKEISTLGAHKDGFWAWANGVYDGAAFTEIDEHGMVEWKGEHYFIPVFGSTTSVDDDDLRNYRKFQYKQNEAMNFNKWAKQFIKVYGNNGRVAIAFYLVSIFRDIIQAKVNFTPMLFLFGQRGSGKSEMVKSLMCLFGEAQDPLMLGGASTVVAFMRKLSQFRNTIVWFDEYKNDIGEKKIESLKNIWDGVGYERGVKDNSNKTTTSQIRSAAILSGQEMPNAEPALFSRVSLLEFQQTQYSQTEIKEYNILKRMQNDGLTDVTHEVLNFKETITTEFKDKFDEVAEMFRTVFTGTDVIERQINNFSVMVTMVWLLEKQLNIPFSHVDMIKISEKLIPQQSAMMRTSNEVQQFWEMVAFLWQNHMITEGVDIQFKDIVSQEIKGKLVYTDGLVMIRLATMFPLYRDYSRRQGQKALDKGTLVRYLKADGAFSEAESDKSRRFEKLPNPTNAFVFLQPKMIKLHSMDLTDFRPKVKNDTQNVDNQ
jgi:energy-coupling factor transporter ATP-binding protein EcfA2